MAGRGFVLTGSGKDPPMLLVTTSHTAGRVLEPPTCLASLGPFKWVAPHCWRHHLHRYDAGRRAFLVRLPAEAGQGARVEFALSPAVVRRNDTSARSVNEWTGERLLRDSDVLDDIEPAGVQALGNYAVQITWQDGFNQVPTEKFNLSWCQDIISTRAELYIGVLFG